MPNFGLYIRDTPGQNNDGSLKWTNGPCFIQIQANFQVLMGLLEIGHFETFDGPMNPQYPL